MATTKAASRYPSYDLSQIQILVVDDNHHMRTLVRFILGALGCRRILEAGDGGSALEVLHRAPIDLVICDWLMEPMDGLEFTRRVRHDPTSPNPYLPIIMMTGYTEESQVLRARDAGITEFLAKPVSAQRIYARIVGIVGNPRPFIRTRDYFGPDRRRRNLPWDGPERRRDRMEESQAGRHGMTPEQIQALLRGGRG